LKRGRKAPLITKNPFPFEGEGRVRVMKITGHVMELFRALF
jgi:hypothetical protein